MSQLTGSPVVRYQTGRLDNSAKRNRALDLSASVASARPYERLNAVMGRLEAYKGAPGVADLLARGPLNPIEIRG